MSALEHLEYTRVDGTNDRNDLKLYTLSTCAFCEKAMKFLEAQGLAYDYVHLDLLETERKKAVKQELKYRHGSVSYLPLLVVNDNQTRTGFVQEEWEALLSELA